MARSADAVLVTQEEQSRSRPRLEVRCAKCGYGAVVQGIPPACPMCRSATWETVGWRPFSPPSDGPVRA